MSALHLHSQLSSAQLNVSPPDQTDPSVKHINRRSGAEPIRGAVPSTSLPSAAELGLPKKREVTSAPCPLPAPWAGLSALSELTQSEVQQSTAPPASEKTLEQRRPQQSRAPQIQETAPPKRTYAHTVLPYKGLSHGLEESCEFGAGSFAADSPLAQRRAALASVEAAASVNATASKPNVAQKRGAIDWEARPTAVIRPPAPTRKVLEPHDPLPWTGISNDASFDTYNHAPSPSPPTRRSRASSRNSQELSDENMPKELTAADKAAEAIIAVHAYRERGSSYCDLSPLSLFVS